jgi:glutathione S-transferase
MADVVIYSSAGCPYAHRTRLTLLEKNVDFTLTEIDLENKPDWFTKVSPLSKVPVIQHGKNRVWESTIINEYLDEVFSDAPLMPIDPGERANARSGLILATSSLSPPFISYCSIRSKKSKKNGRNSYTATCYSWSKKALVTI